MLVKRRANALVFRFAFRLIFPPRPFRRFLSHSPLPVRLVPLLLPMLFRFGLSPLPLQFLFFPYPYFLLNPLIIFSPHTPDFFKPGSFIGFKVPLVLIALTAEAKTGVAFGDIKLAFQTSRQRDAIAIPHFPLVKGTINQTVNRP